MRNSLLRLADLQNKTVLMNLQTKRGLEKYYN